MPCQRLARPASVARVKRAALLVAALLVATPARAEPIDEARALFTEGNARLRAGKAQEAKELLERSFALVPSPNTELQLGRALRELGRRVEAVQALEHAEAEARRRGNAGETRYGQTEAAAHAEAASLRAQLGTLHIRVVRPPDAALAVDGKATAIADEGDTTVLHEPGRIEVVVTRAGEAEAKQVVTLAPGGAAQMEFASRGAAPRTVVVEPAPPATTRPENAWALPAALVAGGVTIASSATFTIFALRSEDAYDTLSERCGPNACGPADRAEADDGKRDQTIANVALAVAGTAAAATLAFVLVKVFSGGGTARVAELLTPTF